MVAAVDQGKERVAGLCQYFATNRQAFLAPGVKEAHVRQTLIDPFFEALGWDVRNAAMAAPQYREVIPEDSLDVEGQQKAPDYTFRVGTLPKFYAEAKKCGVNIGADPAPAYQLRRYGWSAKVALSILTDFEELGVYDCTVRPRPTDKSSHARIQYFRFEEYPDRWRELWDVFSREAVWSGAFDHYAASKRKRGTSEVDVEFLKEIEGWRETLARDIALRNARLSTDDLNAAVQRIIDRIVFLRMAEDRGLEPERQLLKLSEQPDIYPRFMREICRKADDKYNSGIFHFHEEPGISDAPDTLTPRLAVDDGALKPIIQSLYFEHGSPYHFGVLPVEILGTVYERFLGKVIRLTEGHQAKVELKPEVRKAGGVYYTPAYIVEYIVRQTIGRQIEGRSPSQLAGERGRPPLRVLDMACGSGSFLLGAYQCLLDHCLKWYVANRPETREHTVYKHPRTGEWRLAIAERKRILTTHIYGVDIDAQAVEVSKLSLLLKALEGENAATLSRQLALFHARALPNLAGNIKCGNSLVSPNWFAGKLYPDPDEIKRVNPFDWAQAFPDAMKAGGFDCVIGNPPYIRIQTMREWAPLEVEIYKELFRAGRAGNYDIYVIFIEQGLDLLNAKGRLGFICPHKFFNAKYGEPIRGIIADGRHLSHIVHFGDHQIFAGSTTYTGLLFLDKAGAKECWYVKVKDLDAWREEECPEDLTHKREQARGSCPSADIVGEAAEQYRRRRRTTASRDEGAISSTGISQSEWDFDMGPGASLFRRLARMPVKLGDVAQRIFQGLVTGADPVFVLNVLGEGRYFSQATQSKHRIESALMHPLCKGSVNIRRYHVTALDKSILFPYRLVQGKAVLLTVKEMAARYPRAWAYLQLNRTALRNRERGKWRHSQWHALGRSQNLSQMEQPKLLTPSIASRASFTYDEKDYHYFLGSGGGGGGGYGITLKPDCGFSALYLLGLLNSTLLDGILKASSTPYRGGYFAYNRQYIERLPIRTVNLNDSSDKAAHDRMVRLVESMLALHKHVAAANSERQREVMQRQIDATDQEIDRLVYGLYGLTDDEIAIVEGHSR